MDSFDIFKKLSFGTRFSFKKSKSVTTDRCIKDEKVYPLNQENIRKNLEDNTSENSSLSYNISHNSSASSNSSQKDYDTLLTNNLKLLGDIITTDIKQVKNKRKHEDVEEKEMVDTHKVKLLALEKNAQIRNRHKISVLGKNVPAPIENFSELETIYGVSPRILKNIAVSGYAVPTPIQMQALPLMLENKQLLACAPTGSGKTAAFLIPIIHHLDGPRKAGFRALIVCPTRELATQTYRECVRLAEGTGLQILLVNKIKHMLNADGEPSAKSTQKYDILITTPNRLLHFLKQEPCVISLKNVEWLIVDESDKLFEEGPRGFREQLGSIYHACESPNIKRAMFSATQTPHLTKWCRKNLKNLASVSVGLRNSANEVVKQELLFVGSEHGKLVAFRDLIQKGISPPVLVFVQTKDRAQELYAELIYDGINVDMIHSDRTQLQRDNVVRSFREGKIWVLICTELMGRGMDFKGVNLVVNYDFPPSAVSYIHRIGRTGRAGRPGNAVTFFTCDDVVNLRSIAQVLVDSGCEVPSYMLSLKRRNKADIKKLEQKALRRETISTRPSYQRVYDKKLKNAIKRSKRRKKKEELKGKTNK